jgi:predicted DCC family thiol-disulfide oxidoreductase YuxK
MNATTKLPTPRDRPSADVVIYDGNCHFCTRQVERLNRWDRDHKLAYLSLHDPAVQQYVPNLSHDQLMDRMYVVDQKGQQYGGAEALRYLSSRLRRLWPIAPFMHIPLSLPVWQWFYGQVAKRRYQWNKAACEGGTCHIHFKR